MNTFLVRLFCALGIFACALAPTALAKDTATGRTLSDVPKQKANTLGFIGETDVYRVHLHYQPAKSWLQSNAAALTEELVDEMVAANQGRKKLLVFAAAKFMSQRELSRQGVDFCQLPYAIHRILGD